MTLKIELCVTNNISFFFSKFFSSKRLKSLNTVENMGLRKNRVAEDLANSFSLAFSQYAKVYIKGKPVSGQHYKHRIIVQKIYTEINYVSGTVLSTLQILTGHICHSIVLPFLSFYSFLLLPFIFSLHIVYCCHLSHYLYLLRTVTGLLGSSGISGC